MLGVGAAFDFHTGRLKEMRRVGEKMGFHWLHRLLQDPKAPMAPQRGQTRHFCGTSPATGGTEGLSPARAARNLSVESLFPCDSSGHDKGIEPIIFGQ